MAEDGGEMAVVEGEELEGEVSSPRQLYHTQTHTRRGDTSSAGLGVTQSVPPGSVQWRTGSTAGDVERQYVRGRSLSQFVPLPPPPSPPVQWPLTALTSTVERPSCTAP